MRSPNYQGDKVLLECIRPFGNKQPGEQVEVPEGAEFDTAYFKEIVQPTVKKEEKANARS